MSVMVTGIGDQNRRTCRYNQGTWCWYRYLGGEKGTGIAKRWRRGKPHGAVEVPGREIPPDDCGFCGNPQGQEENCNKFR